MTSVIKIPPPTPGFPEYAAIMIGTQDADGNVDQKAFGLRFYAPYVMMETREIDTSGDPKTLIDPGPFKFMVSVTQFNAVLLAAPYVRTTPEHFTAYYGGRLERARVSLKLDGMLILHHFPLRHLLAVPKGRRLGQYVFDLDQRASFQAMPIREGRVFMEEGYGIFMPHGTELELSIVDVPTGQGRIKIEAGCVAAEYTTRDMPGPKDWSPRGFEGFTGRKGK